MFTLFCMLFVSVYGSELYKSIGEICIWTVLFSSWWWSLCLKIDVSIYMLYWLQILFFFVIILCMISFHVVYSLSALFVSIIFIPLCDSYPGISTIIFYVALKLVNILLLSFSILNNLYFIVSQQMVSLLRDYEASVYWL